VAPGGSITEPKTINVPVKPPKADIEIAIDTTGSMGPSIAQAKADAVAIVTGVQGAVPNTQFAVVQFRDAGDSPEYQVVQSMTVNATDVQRLWSLANWRRPSRKTYSSLSSEHPKSCASPTACQNN